MVTHLMLGFNVFKTALTSQLHQTFDKFLPHYRSLTSRFILENFLLEMFSVPVRYKSSPSLMPVLQPRNVFKLLGAQRLNCNQQERQGPCLPVCRRVEPNFDKQQLANLDDQLPPTYQNQNKNQNESPKTNKKQKTKLFILTLSYLFHRGNRNNQK